MSDRIKNIKTIRDLQDYCLAWREERGMRNDRDQVWFNIPILMEEVGELCEAITKNKGPEELGEEAVDIIIMTLNIAGLCGVDVNACLMRKLYVLEGRKDRVVGEGHVRITDYKKVGDQKIMETVDNPEAPYFAKIRAETGASEVRASTDISGLTCWLSWEKSESCEGTIMQVHLPMKELQEMTTKEETAIAVIDKVLKELSKEKGEEGDKTENNHSE